MLLSKWTKKRAISFQGEDAESKTPREETVLDTSATWRRTEFLRAQEAAEESELVKSHPDSSDVKSFAWDLSP